MGADIKTIRQNALWWVGWGRCPDLKMWMGPVTWKCGRGLFLFGPVTFGNVGRACHCGEMCAGPALWDIWAGPTSVGGACYCREMWVGIATVGNVDMNMTGSPVLVLRYALV